MSVSTPAGGGKRPEQFRDYAAEARACVKEFYRLNHTLQTLDAVLEKKRQYLKLDRCEMGVWEAMGHLNALVDDSDPDLDLPQIEHNLQTAESIRAAGHPVVELDGAAVRLVRGVQRERLVPVKGCVAVVHECPVPLPPVAARQEAIPGLPERALEPGGPGAGAGERVVDRHRPMETYLVSR